MKYVDLIAFLLLFVGGLNWGFIGLADFNFVAAIFGAASVLTKVIYLLVGVAAIYKGFRYFKLCGSGDGCCSK